MMSIFDAYRDTDLIYLHTLVVCDTENPKLSLNSSINFFMRVDFPQPDGPTTAENSPSLMDIESP